MNIKEEIKSEELTIVKFGAEWCGPCRMVKPIIEKFSADNKIFDIDVDDEENKSLAKEYGIRSIPTVIFFKNGEIIDKQVGGFSEQQFSELIEKNK